MAVVFEGYCIYSTSMFAPLTGTVTNYSGGPAEDVVAFIFMQDSFNPYVGWMKFLSYNASNQSWKSETRHSDYSPPHVFPIALVRQSDFPNNSYTEANFDKSLAIGLYSCNVASANTQYYWAPATTPLSTPTGLYADNITSDSARINWNAVENASGYKVEYRKQGDTTWNE